jgi:hypothetical protein
LLEVETKQVHRNRRREEVQKQQGENKKDKDQIEGIYAK